METPLVRQGSNRGSGVKAVQLKIPPNAKLIINGSRGIIKFADGRENVINLGMLTGLSNASVNAAEVQGLPHKLPKFEIKVPPAKDSSNICKSLEVAPAGAVLGSKALVDKKLLLPEVHHREKQFGGDRSPVDLCVGLEQRSELTHKLNSRTYSNKNKPNNQPSPSQSELSSQAISIKDEPNDQSIPNESELTSLANPNQGDLSAPANFNQNELSRPSQAISIKDEPNDQSIPDQSELMGRANPNQCELSSKSNPNQDEVSNQAKPNLRELSSEPNPNQGKLNSRANATQGELSSEALPNQGKLSSQAKPNLRELNSDANPNQGKLNSQANASQGEVSSQENQLSSQEDVLIGGKDLSNEPKPTEMLKTERNEVKIEKNTTGRADVTTASIHRADTNLLIPKLENVCSSEGMVVAADIDVDLNETTVNVENHSSQNQFDANATTDSVLHTLIEKPLGSCNIADKTEVDALTFASASTTSASVSALSGIQESASGVTPNCLKSTIGLQLKIPPKAKLVVKGSRAIVKMEDGQEIEIDLSLLISQKKMIKTCTSQHSQKMPLSLENLDQKFQGKTVAMQHDYKLEGTGYTLVTTGGKLLRKYKFEVLKANSKKRLKRRVRKNVTNAKKSIFKKTRRKSYLCPFCGKVIALSYRFKAHVRTHNRPRSSVSKANIQHSCPECDEVFPKVKLLRIHQRTHRRVPKKESFMCEVCGKQVKSNLEDHLLTHAEEKPFECKECGGKFVTEDRLTKHAEIHQTKLSPNARNFVCNMCPCQFSLMSSFKRHLWTHKRSRSTPCDKKRAPRGETDKYTCSVCMESFLFLRELQTHTFYTHPLTETVCSLCEKVIGSWRDTKKHFMLHHAQRFPQPCRRCQIGFPNQFKLMHHVRREHPDVADLLGYYKPPFKPYNGVRTATTKKMSIITTQKCASGSLRNVRFQTVQESKIKRAGRSGGRKIPREQEETWSCSECKRQFHVKQHLLKHLYSHRLKDEPKLFYPCEECGKVFQSKSNLSNHLRTHQSDEQKISLRKKFFCNKCDRKFTKKAHLTVHIHIYHKKGGLNCPVCHKEISLEDSLRKHMATHTSESPVCHICGKACVTEQVLKKHITTHGPNGQTFGCDECGKEFNCQSYLMCHMRNHEPRSIRPKICRHCNVGYTDFPKYENHSCEMDVEVGNLGNEAVQDDIANK